MGEFEQKLQMFSETIYGTEMRESLGWCFHFIYDSIESANTKIRELERKIDELEGSGQNGNVH